MYGCDNGIFNFGRPGLGFASKARKARDNCNHPVASGWIAAAYFIIFAIVGAMILLTLFIGVVVTAMATETEKYDKYRRIELRTIARAAALRIDPNTIEYYRGVFEILDKNNEFNLNLESVKLILPCLPFITKVCVFSFLLSNCFLPTFTFGMCAIIVGRNT